MSPGGTTGMLVQGDGAQPSLPVLTDEDGVRIIRTIDLFIILTSITINYHITHICNSEIYSLISSIETN